MGPHVGLVMLLPHGYEGQGPEHSSARLERYLQLCAEQNMQVCIPSTPAQVYHMIRRQALRGMRRPLVVMSPKSLLRHPLAISSLDELANGSFLPAIGEIDELDPKGVKRVVMCSGKVYYDLLEQRRKTGKPMSPSCVSSSFIHSHTKRYKRCWNNLRMFMISCGVRKSRSTRVPGIAANTTSVK